MLIHETHFVRASPSCYYIFVVSPYWAVELSIQSTISCI